MTYENVLLENEQGVYTLTVNRPKVLNALNGQTLDEIGAAVGEVEADSAARALIVTGSGDRAFVAGADISAMKDYSALEARAFSRHGNRTFRALELLPVPTIALVHGYCLGGGCELAMSCDWIIASDKAVFGQPEVNLGVPPGFGGTQRLTRLIGRGRTMEMLITGRNVKADEALTLGLATCVVPADQLQTEKERLVETLRAKGPVALRLVKEAVQRGQDMDLDNACILESEIFGLAFSTADQKEGMSAFLEKRKPDFRGN